MIDKEFKIRNARPGEFKALGKLMVNVYSQLDGFPKPADQPKYYELLANIGELTKNRGTELLVAVTDEGTIAGGVVYFGDMKYYGSGGTAPSEKNASGFRLLAISPQFRGHGIGKLLSIACIDKAKSQQYPKVIIHSTKAMKIAWNMYERLGFKRSKYLDFNQGELQVYGFELLL